MALDPSPEFLRLPSPIFFFSLSEKNLQEFLFVRTMQVAPIHQYHVYWLVVLGFNANLTAKIIIMAVGDAHVFPGFLTPVLTQLFFPNPPTTFLTRYCRGERSKYARKKVRLNQGSNSQPPLSYLGGAHVY